MAIHQAVLLVQRKLSRTVTGITPVEQLSGQAGTEVSGSTGDEDLSRTCRRHWLLPSSLE